MLATSVPTLRLWCADMLMVLVHPRIYKVYWLKDSRLISQHMEIRRVSPFCFPIAESAQHYLLRASFLEYLVPCRVNWSAIPVLVIWYTHTPDTAIVAPE
jgi:hypothetical protein